MAISDYVIAAMAGNFKHESTVNPGIWESLTPTTFDHIHSAGVGGFGLGQWTNTSASNMRTLKLYNWCEANGYDVYDGNAQAQYIIAENYWVRNYGSIATLSDFLNSQSTDLRELTLSWLRNWEGIPATTIDDRYAYAQRFYNYIQDHKNDDPASYSWISGNRYLGYSEMDNNALCLYFALTGATPPAQNVPIWMLGAILAKRHRNRKKIDKY